MIVTNDNEGFSEVCTSEFKIYKNLIKQKLFYHTLRRYFLLTYGLSIEPEGATTGIYALAKKSSIHGQTVFGIVKQNDHSWLPTQYKCFIYGKNDFYLRSKNIMSCIDTELSLENLIENDYIVIYIDDSSTVSVYVKPGTTSTNYVVFTALDLDDDDEAVDTAKDILTEAGYIELEEVDFSAVFGVSGEEDDDE